MSHEGQQGMDRRRFLAVGATGLLLLAGCARWVGDAPSAKRIASPTGGSAGGATARDRAAASAPTGPPEPEPDVDDPHDEAPDDDPTGEPDTPEEPEVDPELLDASPSEWGENVSGVRTRLADSDAIALTLDACGGPGGEGYDAALIDHLRAGGVPATLFVNARWLAANRAVFDELAADPLFTIENHGTEHRPLSVDGRSAYGISGTASAQAAIEEVLGCQRRIEELTGRAPRLFRSGTAHYDDVAVRIVQELGLEVAGYSVLGDAGATFSAGQVRDQLLGAGPGAIVLLHMNHPASGTADGVAQALPMLLERGRTFTGLDGDQPLT